MSQILKLDEHLANQIAAGEVVERPASVVKELVENAVDAGATQITVEIRVGGTEYIEVRDNGSGIPKEELQLAVQKYATSKIKSIEDLHNVMTFGFRGEALASIASVSEFTLSSHHTDAVSAYSLILESGKKQSLQASSLSQGTLVQVENLFYNTPARLNYLKKPRTEYNHIYEFLQKTALSHPEIGIKFISDDNEVCNFRAGETLPDRIYSIYGKEFSQNILPIDFSYNGLTLTGYITDPKVFFTNKNRQALFVNTRIISSGLIYKALMDGYNRFIPHRTYPGYVLNVTVDPTQIDVNVHPRKLEIRFANEQSIFRLFYHGVKDVLEKVSLASNPPVSEHSSIPNLTPTLSGKERERLQQTHPQPLSENTQKYYTGSGTKFKSYSPYTNTTSNPNQSQIESAMEFSREISGNRPPLTPPYQGGGEEGVFPPLSKGRLGEVGGFEISQDLHYTPLGKIIGQSHNSYIILETSDGIKMLDQHAVAERVIYEKISKKSYTPVVQQLLVGEIYTLTPNENSIVHENIEVFQSMGFYIEELSGNSISINGVPDFVKKQNIQRIFLGILEDIGGQKSGQSTILEEVRNRIFAYTACRAAVKFGDKLSLFEMHRLLCDAALDYSATCPHGRPVVWEMSLEDMKKKYER